MSTLEDMEEIRQLIARYSHLVDSLTIDQWVEQCFTDDAAFEMGGTRTEGRDALLEFGRGIEGAYRSTPMRHVVTNVVIDVDGDDATSESYLQILSVGDQPGVMTTGVYHDRLRRVDGRWLFAERVMEADTA